MLRGRRWLRVALPAAVVVLVATGVAAYVVTRPPGDISNPDVGFVDPTPTPKAPKTKGKALKRGPDPFTWPVYGFTADHRRVFDAPRRLRGPWRRKWRRRAPALLEFPPVIARGLILQLADNGELRAMDKDSGETRWKRNLGRLSASTPAIDGGRVFATILATSSGSSRGRIVALRLRDGKILWSHTLSSRSESSPLVADGKVYFGTEGGTVHALRARGGAAVWTYRASGAVKGSPTLSGGVLYFGDYSGRVHAIRALNGRRVWTVAPARRALRSGTFYATAAVAYGRVYIGSTDGREYSLSARDGRVAWARQTGGYVYSSAAVSDVSGLGPTVFFGSYDGTFYAVDARSGRTRWSYRSGGRISGSPTVIGDVVYFSDLGRERTFGLSARTGRVVDRWNAGGYDPMIADREKIYLTGQGSLTALVPRRADRSRKQRAGVQRRRAEKRQARQRAQARERLRRSGSRARGARSGSRARRR